MAKKERTVEEKKVITAERLAKRTAYKACVKLVLAFVTANTEDAELLNAVKLLTPGNRVGSVRTTARDVIAALFVENGTINEEQLFQDYRLGRAEMRKIRINLIKKAENKGDRLWIDFNPENGEYTLMGQGPEAPEGWTGYTPIVIEDMEIM